MSERKFIAVGVGVLTVSDTRTLASDTSGALVADRLEAMGHRVAAREIVTDDLEQIQAHVRAWAERDDLDVIITTGGTGITHRDVTPEAVRPLFTKHIPGFGELFRMLSYEEIGTSTIQSRADAGLIGGTLVFLLPGSTGACKTAMDRILKTQLDARHRPCNFVELLPRATPPSD